LTAKNLLEFINADGNILALLSSDSVTEDLQDLAKEVDIDIPGKNYAVVDHVNYDRLSADETHNVIVVPPPARDDASKNYFSVSGPIAFSGTGTSLGASPLVNAILTAPRTAYCYDVKEDAVYADSPSNVGRQLALVSALQARNNARLTFVGSAKAFSNEFFDKEVKGEDGKKVKVANKEFADKVAQWTFQVTGVLRVDSIQHSLVNSSDLNPPQYRVKNDIVSHIQRTIKRSLTFIDIYHFSLRTHLRWLDPLPSSRL
jgi:oligosaccharyltransferase complex subunit beta